MEIRYQYIKCFKKIKLIFCACGKGKEKQIKWYMHINMCIFTKRTCYSPTEPHPTMRQVYCKYYSLRDISVRIIPLPFLSLPSSLLNACSVSWEKASTTLVPERPEFKLYSHQNDQFGEFGHVLHALVSSSVNGMLKV